MEQRKFASFTWLYGVAFLAIVAAAVAGISLLRHPVPTSLTITAGATLFAAAVLGFIAMILTLPIALAIDASRKSALDHEERVLTTLQDRLQGISVLMNVLSEQQLLSDRAKSVAYRDKDRDAVRRAVREEIGRQDWEAALNLANGMESEFGYKQEADRFRHEIITQRDQIIRAQIGDMLAPVDRHIKAEAWGTALEEAHAVMSRFPDDPQVQRLPQEIESRRQMRKQQLLDSWNEAVHRHDVDGSIEILKRLDVYLTPAEAESMQETARNVFREKREALRTHFALAVQEQKWHEALRLADEIIRDFPNTRIAQEVREKMEALRKRADEPEEVKAM